MISTNDWLPVGSIVRLEGGERSVMIAGYMIDDAQTKRLWDYVGYPYPDGKRDPDIDYFFNRDMIERIDLVGYLDADGRRLLEEFERITPEYVKAQQEAMTRSKAATDE